MNLQDIKQNSLQMNLSYITGYFVKDTRRKLVSCSLFLFLFLCAYLANAQSPSDTANLRIKDVSTFKMVDTLEFYAPNDTSSLKNKIHGGTVTGMLSESSFTNWSSGGSNAISGTVGLRFYANKRIGKNFWGNTLNMALGYVSEDRKVRKTEDRLDYYFKLSRYLKQDWYFGFLANFKTQLRPGYNYPNDTVIISNFLAPGYTMLKLGLDYMPNPKFKVFIAPLSSKITIVSDQDLANKGAFGVVSGTFDAVAQTLLSLGKNLRYEFGGYLVVSYKGEITPMLKIESEVDLFSNYKHNPQNIDIDWEFQAKVKISKLFSINFLSRLVYDDDIKREVDDEGNVIQGPAIQFKQLLGLGMNLNF